VTQVWAEEEPRAVVPGVHLELLTSKFIDRKPEKMKKRWASKQAVSCYPECAKLLG
jgi:hypothetical protein